MNILVLCTGNSARSILLETILTNLSQGRIKGFSAGSKPAGKVHPQSRKLLGDLNFATDGLRSKSWDEFGGPDAPVMDAVITVCGSAAGETCPFWAGAPIRAHWGVEDPAAAAEADWEDAFQTAYDLLLNRAQALFALPFEEMDRAALSKELNRIGTL
jgi:arsenate reductase (thioredoxin)